MDLCTSGKSEFKLVTVEDYEPLIGAEAVERIGGEIGEYRGWSGLPGRVPTPLAGPPSGALKPITQALGPWSSSPSRLI